MTKVDDITLMAYADGELSGDEEARVAAAIEANPALKEAYENHLQLRATIDLSFDSITDIPVPQRILDTVKEQKHATGSVSAVNRLKAMLLAPALVAAMFAVVFFSANQMTPAVVSPSAVAPAIASALSSMPDNSGTEQITIRGSYLDDTRICRTFSYASKTADSHDTEVLSCATRNGEWTKVVTSPYIPENVYLPAGSDSGDTVRKRTGKMQKLSAEELQAYLAGLR